MIIPCIDLMGGKVVQLIQGHKKALEAGSPVDTLEKFSAFPEIQVIDLDAAMDQGSNDTIVRNLASRAVTRVGGGVRSVARARALLEAGASKIIVGTAAFRKDGVNERFLQELKTALGHERILLALDSRDGRIVVKGWKEGTALKAMDVIHRLEPYCAGFLCTYVDKEGMLEGTHLDWYRQLRNTTRHELTAAGGISSVREIEELAQLQIHAALGMAIYTDRLSLDELAATQNRLSKSFPSS